MNRQPDLQKAKNYAFLLLKFRPRSEKELFRRLKNKKFDESIIKDTITFLKNKDFIDDNYFARSWIESRLKKPLGIRKIREELRLKGIDREIIDSQIQEIRKDYSEEDIIRKIAKARFSRIKGVDFQKAKTRVFSYLLRRGFSPDVVIDIIDKVKSVPKNP